MSSPPEPLRDIVRRLTAEQLRLGDRELSLDDDLWNLGMTSLTCMGLMLEIEDSLGVELPANQLNHETFASVNGIVAAVESARAGVSADEMCART
jgi:acyl carrier protein